MTCNHNELKRLEGPLHPSGKDYVCGWCGQQLRAEPLTVGVTIGPPAESATPTLSQEQVRQCEEAADADMFANAPKIGQQKKLRYDAHKERRQHLTRHLNALLVPPAESATCWCRDGLNHPHCPVHGVPAESATPICSEADLGIFTDDEGNKHFGPMPAESAKGDGK